MKRSYWVASASLAAFLALWLSYRRDGARADGPPTQTPLYFAGELEDDNQPVDGAQNIAVRFWDAVSDGSSLCATTPPPTLVSHGHFRIALDAACAQAVRAQPNLWVEVLVDGIPLGRSKVGAVPYALEAQRASDAAGALAQAVVPPGAVMAFDLDQCPAGWTPFAAAAGRAVVGVDGTRPRGTQAGAEQVALTIRELPEHAHTHNIRAAVGSFNTNNPPDPLYSQGGTGVATAYGNSVPSAVQGQGQPFSNLQPSLFLLYCRKS
jgi:hypothetical protein